MTDTPAVAQLVADLVALLDPAPLSEDRFEGPRKKGGVGRVFGGQVIGQALEGTAQLPDLSEWQPVHAVVQALREAVAPSLDACGTAEMHGLLAALAGGHFITGAWALVMIHDHHRGRHGEQAQSPPGGPHLWQSGQHGRHRCRHQVQGRGHRCADRHGGSRRNGRGGWQGIKQARCRVELERSALAEGLRSCCAR